MRARRSVLLTGLAGFLLASALFGVYVVERTVKEREIDPRVEYETRLYLPPENGLEWALIWGDGHTFAALAQDPTLAHDEVFVLGEESFAYRAQRPLFGWIGWIGSLGQASLVPLVLAATCLLGIGALAAVTACWLAQVGAQPRLALAVLVMPGVVADLRWACPEALGAAMAVSGFLLWRRAAPGSNGRRWAVALFVLATLTRETFLLVPAALVLDALLERASWRERLRVAAPLLVAPAAYAAWVVLVYVRVGAWPNEFAPSVVGVPFVGLAGAVGVWDLGDIAFAVLVLGAGCAALVCVRDRAAALLIGLHLAVAVSMGSIVWKKWEYWSRPLLPLTIVSLVVLVSHSIRSPAIDTAEAEAPLATVSA